ncbi:MAG: NFACT family protein [Clostridia bacterium]|nr:NFACT family protein [Clostridia bacterium]
MALDGIFLKLLASELAQAADSRIEKIYQPQKDALVFFLRRAGFHKKLLFCLQPGSARVQFTELDFPNPDKPPMLCMLLRKTLCGGKILSFTTDRFERVLTLTVETNNEMGDRVVYRVVCELIGSKSNLILVNPTGRIVDAVRRSDIESGARMIQPGAVYTPPEKQDKADLSAEPLQELTDRILQKDTDAVGAVQTTLDGVSPLIAREIAYRAGGETGFFSPKNREALHSTLLMIKDTLLKGGTPTLLLDKGTPTDFTFMPIMQYGARIESKKVESYSFLLDLFYKEKAEKQDKAARAADILKLLRTLSNRTAKKIQARRADLQRCENRERLRIYGELLKANLHLVEKGASAVRVQNYYEPDFKEISIPLNPALSPAQNAAKYFKDYKKLSNAAGMLQELIADSEREMQYIDSVFDCLSRAQKPAELEEIRAELADAGLYRKNNAMRRKKAESEPLRFMTDGGFTVLVGKNNTQNDRITTRMATKEDYWFHTKDIPGAHTLLICNGRQPADADLEQAAQLAAGYSKAAESELVPVDMVQARYVKKPAGARPGMVIFKNQTTVFVNPMKGTQTSQNGTSKRK